MTRMLIILVGFICRSRFNSKLEWLFCPVTKAPVKSKNAKPVRPPPPIPPQQTTVPDENTIILQSEPAIIEFERSSEPLAHLSQTTLPKQPSFDLLGEFIEPQGKIIINMLLHLNISVYFTSLLGR